MLTIPTLTIICSLIATLCFIGVLVIEWLHRRERLADAALVAKLADPLDWIPSKNYGKQLDPMTWHNTPDGFRPYRRKQIAELRPYVEGETLDAKVSISKADKDAGSPKPGDMIARNPKNHDDQWLVAGAYFADNFEPAEATQ